jgi:hypothetical protein
MGAASAGITELDDAPPHAAVALAASTKKRRRFTGIPFR